MDIRGVCSINGAIKIPGDKSISHRSAIISSLVDSQIVVKNYLFSKDCISTLDVLKKLGVSILKSGKELVITGPGLSALKESREVLEVGNSGTTIRLISGVLAGNDMMSVLSGDSSINQRPMARIIVPLNQMGAVVYGRENNTRAPVVIFGNSSLKGKRFELGLSSAQVKSCIILAGLHAEGPTEIYQPEISRDHTERMLEYFEAGIEYDGKSARIDPVKKLRAKDITIPADLSSALFFIVAALILKESHIIIKDVGINPTRSYILEVLRSMGGKIDIRNKRTICNEPIADIEVLSSELVQADIKKEKIPNIIDEIPILCVAASVARGNTIIKGAQELRNKESDRLKAISTQFRKAGVNIRDWRS